MKIKLVFKDPDAVHAAAIGAAQESVNSVAGITDAERDSLVELRAAEYIEKLEKWFRWGEYCEVEIDIDEGTGAVLKP